MAGNIMGIGDVFDARTVYEFFQRANLPLPEENEFYYGSGDSRIIFLSDHGLTIRVSQINNTIDAEHPYILKPLFSKVAGTRRIDINPGIESPVSLDDAASLRGKFDDLGLNLWDDKVENIGYIPGTDRKQTVLLDIDRMSIAIDRISLKELRSSTKTVDAILRRARALTPEMDNPQEEIYAPLRESVEKAMLTADATERKKHMASFLSLCKEFKAEGKLLSGWEQHTYRETTAVAEKYTQRLRTMAMAA